MLGSCDELHLGLERLLQHIRGYPEVWLATSGEIADYSGRRYPPESFASG